MSASMFFIDVRLTCLPLIITNIILYLQVFKKCEKYTKCESQDSSAVE